MNPLFKKPSAWIPVAIPLCFLAYIAVHFLVFGVVQEQPEADEGTGAHLFQLWLLAEPFMLGFFAVRWLPQAREQALQILALQVLAALLPIALIFSLGL